MIGQLIRACKASIREAFYPPGAVEIQRRLDYQKRKDLFDIQCQSCGGLGVVIDLDNWLGIEPDGNPAYGGKICPECNAGGMLGG